MMFGRVLSLAVFIMVCGGGGARAQQGHAEKALLEIAGIKGGVVVHLGCGNGKSTAALFQNDRFLVYGLDTDPEKVKQANDFIDDRGIYGSVSCEVYDGKHLPFGDAIVNCVILSDRSQVTPEELERVLVPNGVAVCASGVLDSASMELFCSAGGSIGSWKFYRKPRSAKIDEWTHFLYDASGNAVSKDKKAGRPRHVQWYADPRHSRHHDALASLSAMTSSGGRFFYIYDEGPVSVIHQPPDWKLIARDAFNGKLLWKRPIHHWMSHLYNFRAGPKQLPRLLVSVGDKVFATLGFDQPTVRLDAATGTTERTYQGSEKTEELIYHDGVLFVVTGDLEVMNQKVDGCFGYWEMAEYEEPTVEKSIITYDAESGEELWKASGSALRNLVPLSLCTLGDKVFYLDNSRLHCRNLHTGDELWTAPFASKGWFIRSYAPTVVAQRDAVLCLKWNYICCYDAETGTIRWEKNKGSMQFGAPADLFVIGTKAWTNPMRKSIWKESRRNADGIVLTGINIPKSTFFNNAETGVGISLETGEVTDLLPFAHTQHHHRCYRDKATEQYIFIGHSGIQVVDLKTRKSETNRWVRGICQYGIMPANGYLYVPPDPCQCYNSGKINGFFALSENNSWGDIIIESAVQKGPAFDETKKEAEAVAHQGKADDQWPVYRADNARSGFTAYSVPSALTKKWSTDVGGAITAPVIAGGKVYVAETNAYTVYCLDAENGTILWKYLAHGQIDSPPAIAGNRCVFGCGDGSVYCLDAKCGRLAWRFLTSKREHRIGYEDRLASPLRIHGSVLVVDGIVYFSAGYSSNLDGGIRLYGIDLKTGSLRYENKLASGYWGDDGRWGFLDDVLAFDDTCISMRQTALTTELKRTKTGGLITSSTGLLDTTWFHRQSWSARNIQGQLIVADGSRFFSVVNGYTGLKQRRKGQYQRYNQVGHFHQKFSRYKKEFFPVGVVLSAASVTKNKKQKTKPLWSKQENLQVRAMIGAGGTLCAAGWIDDVSVEMKTGRPKDPKPEERVSVLRLYKADSGKRIGEIGIDAEPVFDGLAAAYGSLFLSLKNGRIVKYSGRAP